MVIHLSGRGIRFQWQMDIPANDFARACTWQHQHLDPLKNENRALPLKKTVARIHVAGKSAEDLGDQCGGWTIDWQGNSGDVTPGGTTFLER